MDGGKWDTTEKSQCGRRLGSRSPRRAGLPHQLKQVRRRPQNSTYTWSLKCDTKDRLYEAETDSKRENRFVLPKEGWEVTEGETGSLGKADAN